MAAGDGYKTFHDFKAFRGRQRRHMAATGMNRQTLAVSKTVEQPVKHLSIFDVPSQRSNHRRPEKQYTRRESLNADGRQCLAQRFQALLTVGQTR